MTALTDLVDILMQESSARSFLYSKWSNFLKKVKSEQKKADWQYIIFLNEAVTQYMLR